MKKIRVIELFAGYGSQHLALKRLKRDYPEFEYEVVAFCEIDDNAIKAYHALHGDHIPNLGDITQVNPSDVPDCDLMTWSFPCQSISSAGLQHGLAEGSGTRSSLCWNAMRIFEVKRPKYLLMENVSALVSDKFIGDFNLLQSSLQKIGYTNFTQLMNAKDYGVPQNRLRVFMVSVLDCSQAYYFPKPFHLERRLKDVLETNVPDRYYLSQERLAGLKLSNEKEKEAGRGFEFAPKSTDSVVANAVSTNAGGRKTDNFLQEPIINKVGYYSNSQAALIVDSDGVSPAVINGDHAGTPKIADPLILANPHGYYEGGEYSETSPAVRSSAFQANTAVAEPLPAAARGRAAGDWHTSQHNQTLELGDPAAANSVTSVAKDSMIVEPAILQQKRTEEGKEIRRQHKGDKGIPYAHKELSPRGDGISNTLSTVDHDNLLAEPAVLGWTRSGDSKGNPTYHPVEVANCVTAAKRDNTQNYVVEPTRQDLIQYHLTDDGNLRAYIDDEKKTGVSELQITNPDNPAPTLTGANHAKVWQPIEELIEQAKTAHPSRGIIMIKNTPCWVRRLTERELFRLQDVDEPDIDTLLNAGISNTQLAKLAGNSIVTACMYHIFLALFIETTPPPNTQTQLF